LFEVKLDPTVVRERALSADSDLICHCTGVVRDHAARHGWSKRQTNDVIRSLRLLQVLQDTPGAKIRATDVQQLPRYDGNINSTLDVLGAAGMLIDDRPSHVERYFAGKTARLPEPMRAQLETWLEVMVNGSTLAPRQRSRDPQTARIHILGITPVLQAWADAGHRSLAEITPEQVRAALPASGPRRNWAEYGLRSLFKVLKARKMIFTDPTRGLPVTAVNTTVPLPLDTEAIRQALNSPDSAIALAVALVAFHAVTAQQLSRLRLTDIVDGRLCLEGPRHPPRRPGTSPAHRMARPPGPDLARHHQPAPVRHEEERPPAHSRRQAVPLAQHGPPPSSVARRPDTPRDTRHRRRRPADL
jgi:hypothetical protein